MITRRQHEESVASIKFRVDGEVLAGRCIVIPEVRTRDESCCSVGLGRLPAAYKEANASILPDDIVFRIHLLQNTMMDHVVTVQRLRAAPGPIAKTMVLLSWGWLVLTWSSWPR